MRDRMGAVSEFENANGGDLSILDLDTEYRSLKDGPVDNFYIPCLHASASYKRAAGYFRSSVLLVIGSALVDFSRKGGRTLLICSPELSVEDIDAIATGYARKSERIQTALLSQIEELLASEQTAHHTRVLATLVAAGCLEIKLAMRSDRRGVYHEKIGIFTDTLGNKVSFKGSTNETWSGWHRDGNFESIEVFCGWRGGLESVRVRKHEMHFDSLWSEADPDVEVFPFPANAMGYLKKVAFRGLDEVSMEPLLPQTALRKALPHQEAAVAAWEKCGQRGIFEHATGSGKTFTAILVIRKHISLGLPALVVVPSQLLLLQWAEEIREYARGAALILAGGGNDKWRRPGRLRAMTSADRELGGRVVIATMQTASLPDFRGNVESGPHLLIVADEVHQVGSTKNSRILEIETGPRLGLSATPSRYGDPEGTQKIYKYFGGIISPAITLFDAVRSGRLVPYEYHPHPVHLSAEEAEAWRNLSLQIKQEMARQKADESGKKHLSDRARLLLIRRSVIAKKATSKIGLATQVLNQNYRTGQSWLVYCEDSDQLNEVLHAFRNSGLDAVEYHSGMTGDKSATLSWFRSFGGILVSIRCLDEGVDIPAVTHALILASSQNPRQFIQRRGRVLRRTSGKHLAIIHDAVVVPVSADDEPEQIALLKAELVRAVEFAQHAVNQGAAAELRGIAISLGLNPDLLIDDGLEDEGNE